MPLAVVGWFESVWKSFSASDTYDAASSTACERHNAYQFTTQLRVEVAGHHTASRQASVYYTIRVKSHFATQLRVESIVTREKLFPVCHIRRRVVHRLRTQHQ